MRRKDKLKNFFLNNKLKIGLFLALLIVTIGYAAINTNLNLLGFIAVKSNSKLKVFFKSVSLDGVSLDSQINNNRESFTFKQSQIAELGDSTFDYEIVNRMEDYDANVSLSCTPEYHNYTVLSYNGEERLLESGASDIGTITASTNTPLKLKLYDAVKNQSLGNDSGINFNEMSSATNGEGVYSTTNTDSEKEVYYFRGNVSNNNVIFNDSCWLIIRTTETGGVKVLYNGSPSGGRCESAAGTGIADIHFNELSDDNTYVGYMYGSTSSSYENTHRNLHSSTLKQTIDEWYENNLLGKPEAKLLEDTVWCSDRTLSSGTGTGTNVSKYAFAGRVTSTTKNPTLKCTRDIDKLTVSSGYLTYPIATLTADEAIYAGMGGVFSADGTTEENRDMYLFTNGGTFWTMTPMSYAVTNGTRAQGISVFGFGNISVEVTDVSFRTMGVRPAISFKPNVQVVSGDGTNDSPYIIAVQDEDDTEYTCTLNIKLAEQEDKLIGKEYCFGTECFEIIDYDGENFKLLAKYNLYVGANTSSTSSTYRHQDPRALGDANTALASGKYVGTVAFGSTNDYSKSTIKGHVDTYVNWLNATYGIEATGRLITVDELTDLGCVLNVSNGCGAAHNPKNYEWVTRTTYYTGTGGAKTNQVYIVGGDGYFNVAGVTGANNRGIRPLIIVPKGNMPNIKPPADTMPVSWLDDGIFFDYYKKAYQKLKTMSTQEKVGQILVASYSSTDESAAYNAVSNYNVGGLVFYEEAFADKSISDVQNMISGLQSQAKIPLMTAVDEEGGVVCRISTYTDLVSEEMSKYPELFYTTSSNKNAWKVANTLYEESGNNFDLVKREEKVRNALLKKLGLNMNFAPVSDISSSSAYMADRSFGTDPDLVSRYVSVVVKAGQNSGVSHSLKHFPGYGNNSNTHTSSSIDESSLDDLYNIHLKPFKAGIESGAETVMISHNIISALDTSLPASLSQAVHNLLFDELKFTGLAITDDLAMDAVGNNYSQQYLKAFKAGNHILLVSNQYETAYNELTNAIDSGEITYDELNRKVFRVLAWKYYMGLLND